MKPSHVISAEQEVLSPAHLLLLRFLDVFQISIHQRNECGGEFWRCFLPPLGKKR